MTIIFKIFGKRVKIIDNVAHCWDKELENDINFVLKLDFETPTYMGYYPQLLEIYRNNIELLEINEEINDIIY